MRTGGNNLGYPSLPKQLHVLLGHPLKEVLVAQAPDAVAAAQLFLAQHPPGDPGRVQDGRHCDAYLLVAAVEGAGAPHEEQVLGLSRLEGALPQIAAPLGPLGGGDPPRVAALLHVLEQVQKLFRETGLLLHQVPAQLDDLGHLFDQYGADRGAGPAGGAGPERLLADGAVGRLSDERQPLPRPPLEKGAVLHQVRLEVVHDPARVERFAGVVRRAEILAAAALGAGQGVEQVLPAVLLDLAHPVALPLGEGLALGQVRLFAPEKTIGNGGEDVHMLAARQKVHEGEQHQRMHPPGGAGHPRQERCGKRLQQEGDRAGNRPPGTGLSHGDTGAREQEECQHQGADQAQDEQSLETGGLGVVVTQVLGWEKQTPGAGDQHARQGNGGEDVEEQSQESVQGCRQERQADTGEESLDQKLPVGEQ